MSKEKIGVLVVDDDVELLRSFLGVMRLEAELKPYVCSSCNKALWLIKELDSIEVVITDKGLAKKECGFLEQDTTGSTGGLAFIHQIREERPDIRTILMSGESNLRIIAEQSGVWGVVQKPGDSRKIAEACSRGMLLPGEQQSSQIVDLS